MTAAGVGRTIGGGAAPSSVAAMARKAESATMAWFMDIHSGFVGVTEQQLREAHERDLEIESDEGVHFERAWLDPVIGKVFCLSSGPSREAIMRIHERAGHPTAEVYELQVAIV